MIKCKRVYRKRKYRRDRKRYKGRGHKINYNLLEENNKKYITIGLIVLFFLALNLNIIVYKYYKYFKESFPTTKPNIVLEKGISKEEAKKYVGKNVFMVLNNFAKPYAIYGMVIDIIRYEGEWHVILKTHYNSPAEQFIKCKNISYIRERYKNE